MPAHKIVETMDLDEEAEIIVKWDPRIRGQIQQQWFVRTTRVKPAGELLFLAMAGVSLKPYRLDVIQAETPLWPVGIFHQFEQYTWGGGRLAVEFPTVKSRGLGSFIIWTQIGFQ